MDPSIYVKLKEKPALLEYLKQNSDWIKPLIRNPNSINDFEKFIKEKYHLRFSDKANDLLENIDLISTILDNVK